MGLSASRKGCECPTPLRLSIKDAKSRCPVEPLASIRGIDPSTPEGEGSIKRAAVDDFSQWAFGSRWPCSTRWTDERGDRQRR